MDHRSAERAHEGAGLARERAPSLEDEERHPTAIASGLFAPPVHQRPAPVGAAGVLALQRAIGNRAVQRYIQVGKATYNVADLRTKKNDPLMKSLAKARTLQKGKPPGAEKLFDLLKDPDITFVFRDESAFEAFMADPKPTYYSMAMKFDPKKACIAQALELAGTGKSAQKWHDAFLAAKINYTEDTEIGTSLGFAGFEAVGGITGKVEDILPQLDELQTYILIGGSKAELHAVIYKDGDVRDTQGVNTKGVQIDFVYRKK